MPPSIQRRAPRSSLSDELRDLIDRDGRRPHAIAREAGIDPGILSRFLAGLRGVTSDTLDALAPVLGLHLTAARGGRGRPRRPEGPKALRARRDAGAGPSLAPEADPGAEAPGEAEGSAPVAAPPDGPTAAPIGPDTSDRDIARWERDYQHARGY